MIEKITIQVERFVGIPNCIEIRSSIETPEKKVSRSNILDIALLDYQSYFDLEWQRIGEILKRHLIGDIK